MKIVCVGECTRDYYINQKEDKVGGISLNFAVHARRFGVENVSMVSCVGDDAAGEHVLDVLGKEGIDRSHIYIRSGRTPQQDILLAEGGERIFPPNGYHVGVLADFQLDSSDIGFICTHNVLDAPCFSQIERLFDQTMRLEEYRGVRVADFQDLSDFDQDISVITRYLDVLDLVFLSGDREISYALQPFSRQYKGVMVITMGDRGSQALFHGELITQPAITINQPVDTTGCGDAFRAACTLTYLRTRNLHLALKAGAEVAAEVVNRLGAI